MIYLDTSAFIKLYFLEKGSPYVQSCVASQDEPLPIWDLLEAEVTNACRLKAFWGDITPTQADEQLALFQQRVRRGQYFLAEIDRSALMGSFRELSAQTPQLGCRTIDILHVACAMQLAPERFISYDERQRNLAKNAGLTVLPEAA